MIEEKIADSRSIEKTMFREFFMKNLFASDRMEPYNEIGLIFNRAYFVKGLREESETKEAINLNSEITNAVKAARNRAQYDECAKRLLGQKSILAHILVNTVDEFKGRVIGQNVLMKTAFKP